MAPKQQQNNPAANNTPNEQPVHAMDVEEMKAEILRVELETKRLGLAEAKKRNFEFQETERRRHESNQRRMGELQEARENRWSVIKKCRHKSGGTPANILRGGGVGAFSLLTRAVMPDGVTIFMQCPRCRLGMYTPTEKTRQLWFESYAEELKYWQGLLETCIEFGLEHAVLRGPTFMFKNKDGVPIIPERV